LTLFRRFLDIAIIMERTRDLRQCTPQEQEATRRAALRDFKAGMGKTAVARKYGVSRQALYNWIAAYRRDPRHGLDAHTRGRPSRLTPKQLERLDRMLVEGPRAHGFKTQVWTLPRVRDLVEKTFGVRYHWAHFSRLLRRLGFTPQKPQRRASERDEPAIEKWRKRVFPPDPPKSRPRGKTPRGS
jgi:transposase